MVRDFEGKASISHATASSNALNCFSFGLTDKTDQIFKAQTLRSSGLRRVVLEFGPELYYFKLAIFCGLIM